MEWPYPLNGHFNLNLTVLFCSVPDFTAVVNFQFIRMYYDLFERFLGFSGRDVHLKLEGSSRLFSWTSEICTVTGLSPEVQSINWMFLSLVDFPPKGYKPRIMFFFEAPCFWHRTSICFLIKFHILRPYLVNFVFSFAVPTYLYFEQPFSSPLTKAH